MMDDLLNEFLTETTEGLTVLDGELVKLEQSPNDPELLGNIFRIVHTIKGTSGFLGLSRLQKVAHASENVLGKIRDGAISVTPAIITLVLESLDRIKAILAGLEVEETEPEGDDSALIGHLDQVLEQGGVQLPPPPPPMLITSPIATLPPAEEPSAVTPPPATAKPATTPPATAKPATPAKKTPPAGGGDSPGFAASTIRVNVDLLENLMTMVSELVLTRNQLMQILRSEKDSAFVAPLQRLNHVTSELQEGVMKTRMQPIGNAWAKLPRLVRDLAVDVGKKIDLQMYGADTELDRQVLELVKDPLTHMVRNSADHGLEMPQVRVAAGKSEIGQISLNAFHEGGHIIIEIADDGAGLNIERIREKVIRQGMQSESELDGMTDHQIQMFIFKPGFSTAQQITQVSGRGVGMDVVRTNVERIGGTIDLKSTQGRGSTFRIKIPLTLAIVNALIVKAGGDRFAVPQISVEELVRVSDLSDNRVERIKDTPVLRLRNRLLPLVSLKNVLRLDETPPESDNEQFVVVTQVGSYHFGLIVDEVFDTEEIVVKPVAPILRNITTYSGNTILGDGSVVMILDPNGIAQATGEITVTQQPDISDSPRRSGRPGEQLASLLLFRADNEAPKAVPLGLVARLEEIDLAKIEFSDNRPVVQYRDQLMPIIPINRSYEVVQKVGRKPVVVFSDRGHTMGLLVDEIVDIVEEHMTVQLTTERPGLLGSAIIGGHATDVIDAGYYLTQAFHDWFGLRPGETETSGVSGNRLLLVDDSPFFRNLLTPLLSIAGYDVTAVANAFEAEQMYEDGQNFDLIISDIEMPEKDGFEFARSVRSSERWADVPMVALSSYATARDLERGREVGFTDYVAKFDREALLETLAQVMAEARAEKMGEMV